MASGVFFANGFGDYVINRSALAALASVIPRPSKLICSEGPHEFLMAGLGFDEVIAIPMRSEAVGRSFDVDHAAERLGRCEMFIDLAPWPSTTVPSLARKVQAARTFGYGEGYDVVVPRDFSKNAVELAFDVARAVDPRLDVRRFKTFPDPSPRATLAVDQIIDWKERAQASHLLAVHADTFPHKTWSAEGFRRVIGSVLDECPQAACVIVGHQPPPLILDRLASRMICLQGFSLESSMAIVSRSDAFLGIDSCMLHAADFTGVAGTLLFGPSTCPKEWGYYWSKGVHLQFEAHEDFSIVDATAASLIEQLSPRRQME